MRLLASLVFFGQPLAAFAQDVTFTFEESRVLFSKSAVLAVENAERDFAGQTYFGAAVSGQGDWMRFFILGLEGACDDARDEPPANLPRRLAWHATGSANDPFRTFYRACKFGKWAFSYRPMELNWTMAQDIEGATVLKLKGLLVQTGMAGDPISFEFTRSGLKFAIKDNSAYLIYDLCRRTARDNLICERHYQARNPTGSDEVAAYYLLKVVSPSP